jgi:hypothetical protein
MPEADFNMKVDAESGFPFEGEVGGGFLWRWMPEADFNMEVGLFFMGADISRL